MRCFGLTAVGPAGRRAGAGRRRGFRATVVLFALAAGFCGRPGAAAEARPAVGATVLADLGCPLTVTESADVTAVVDGRTLRLLDGREVLLAGIEVDLGPAGDDGGAGPSPESGAAAGILRALMPPGRAIVIGRSGREDEPDRWGRVVAHVLLPGVPAGSLEPRGGASPAGSRSRAAAPRWTTLQNLLVSRGLALVDGKIGGPCRNTLLAAEREARDARRGLWAAPGAVALPAEAPEKILRRRGHFALVEGTVLSVGHGAATVYLNFGRRWSQDVTVTIARRIAKRLAAAGLDPDRLAGRRVAVRGIVETWGGPRIEVLRPEQIAIVGE